MRVEHTPDSTVIHFEEAGTARSCGACQLCCRLLPVLPLSKPAGQKCEHQAFGRGCRIYAERPRDCRIWSCRWLVDPSTAALRRPDRTHYVVDVMPEMIRVSRYGGRVDSVQCVQVWCDPDWPNAHRDAALRRYLDDLRMPAIIRYGTRRGFVLFAPSISDDGQWHEVASEVAQEPYRESQEASG